MSKMLF